MEASELRAFDSATYPNITKGCGAGHVKRGVAASGMHYASVDYGFDVWLLAFSRAYVPRMTKKPKKSVAPGQVMWMGL